MCQFLFGRFENFLYKPACFAIPFLLLYKYPPSLCNLGLDTYLQVCRLCTPLYMARLCEIWFSYTEQRQHPHRHDSHGNIFCQTDYRKICSKAQKQENCRSQEAVRFDLHSPKRASNGIQKDTTSQEGGRHPGAPVLAFDEL